jgi:septum formation protein
MLIGIPDHFSFILASRSPRRQQLLRELGLKVDIVIKDYEEKYPDNLEGAGIAEYLAQQKSKCFINKIGDNQIVITADTIVWCNNMVLDKPANHKEAFDILKIISGNTHDVITGICLRSNIDQRVFSETTKVTFEPLSEEEINYYIKNFRPFDKAGAYGIQEWIGMAGISRIEGSYFNVMGLPVHRLYKELKIFINSTL